MDNRKVFAEIYFYPPNKIGEFRKYNNKYIPAFKIRNDMYNSGQLLFYKKEVAIAGDKVKGEVKFLHFDLIEKYISVGKKYYFYEGPYKLGEILITKIIDN